MKTIEVDNELYRYIASQTHHIGESASDILRRLLLDLPKDQGPVATLAQPTTKPLENEISKEMAKSDLLDRTGKIQSLLVSDLFLKQEKAIGRFMLVLSALYFVDGHAFSQAAALKGRTRLYFSDNEDTLLESGKTTKPKQIPRTPFWVITNTNTGRKRQMVEQMMLKMGFNEETVLSVTVAI